jgi:ring-1,2-phenylacetyl-CoA epoxidase subunit PaaB
MTSLDPRVNRLPLIAASDSKAALDQLVTFQVFVRPKDGKPFQHEGAVHAHDLELAFVLAKETFTRRFTCADLCVCETKNVFVSPFTEDQSSAYSSYFNISKSGAAASESFEIFHLTKRGKQHVHAGQFNGVDAQEAISYAAEKFANVIVFNIWAIRTKDIRFSTEEEREFWSTLPEKKFRDATDYKGGDKLKEFLERHK